MAGTESLMELDAANVYADAIGEEHGLAPADVEALSGRIAEYHDLIEERRGKDIGFMERPYDRALADAVGAKAEELRAWCKNFVVLGIGGSALGNIAVHSALNHQFHNVLSAGATWTRR